MKFKNEDGQTLIEFILLMILIIGLSMSVKSGVKNIIGTRWNWLIFKISAPTQSNIKL